MRHVTSGGCHTAGPAANESVKMISHITNDYRAAIATAATVAEQTRAATEHMERTHLEHHPMALQGLK